LIGIPDFGLAEAESGVECGQAKAGLQGCWRVPN
jgi:hypothetical protein